MGIFYIGIHGILQTDYFSGYNPKLTNYRSSPGKFFQTGNKTSKTEDKTVELLQESYDKLISYMESEKPYLDTTLNLSSLAAMLDMKPHFLSMLINQKSNRNFFDKLKSKEIVEKCIGVVSYEV